MDDLRVMPGPGIPRGLVIPAAALVEQFSHASGPGGQGVNTADSRVQLSVDLALLPVTDAQRGRVLTRLAPRITDTTLIVAASEHRSQLRNRVAARERVAQLIREALAPETPRRATRPTRSSQRRRLEDKRSRSETKQNRRRPTSD
ncbi:alternative ribosome rescue aminoacyl-tRNA hydrolase ArfB [Microbacterium gorillae]|uniref:alternative ribosome rescue aminoacyl-tRNA hydrolase ArfB n=1 Tax=Microbacterium gorillae TaxID=1231063 RepID=UPI003D961621